jgi:uncharacterized membrane protein
MEVLIFAALATILIILVTSKNKLEEKLTELNKKIDSLSDDLKRIRSIQPPTVSIKEEKKTELLNELLKEEKPIVKQAKAPEPVPFKEEKKAEPELVKEEVKIVEPAPFKKEFDLPPVPKKPGFFERNPDLEKFIGENLANKIGIAILVLGVGFFVKYAIDQEWINEIGRVAIGILCGGALLGVAHRLRKSFNTFSSVLVGGGIAVLYLTITIAFQQYHIFNQTAAFLIMVLITAFTVFLSLGYNKQELAILAILGGFGSPMMVATGEGNYIVLFTYVLILDGGMLTLAYFKKWRPINVISYVLTILLFGSWLIAKYDPAQASMIRGALIFATLFYFVFFAMSIINNIKERTAFKAFEFSLLLSNTFLYYGAGMFILHNEAGMPFRGLFTVLLGIFNFAFAFSLFKKAQADRNLIFLLIGLVLTFISLAAPIQLRGNYITLFWSAEAVLLLWLSQKSGIKLMKIASVVLLALMLISLMMDWNHAYVNGTDPLTILFNKVFITGLFSLAALVATFYLLKKESADTILDVHSYKNILSFVIILVLYLVNLLELRYHLEMSSLDWPTQTLAIGIYNMIFILGLLLAEGKISVPDSVRPWFVALGLLALLAYFSIYQRAAREGRDAYLMNSGSFVPIGLHYLYLGLVIAICVLSIRRFRKLVEFNVTTHQAYAWLYTSFFVYLASAELDTLVVLALYSNPASLPSLLTQNHKIGFPILWGVASFLLIFYGLREKNKTVRIISLTLFFITLVKLFLVDIRGISEGGKIAAFISLGVLLLIVSFMYQKLKKLLLSDEESKTV